jgi:LPS export ABC transporter protein LptC
MIIRFFLILIFLFSACKTERLKPPVDYSFKDEYIPTQESWNSEVIFSDSGKIKAILNAGHIQVFPQRNETLLEDGIKVDFFDQNEIKTSTLTSKRGRVDDITSDLFAIDSVVVFSDSVTILTELIQWKNDERKIVSDKFVTILSPTEKIQGYGFESDQSLKNYVIFKITYVTRRDTLQ